MSRAPGRRRDPARRQLKAGRVARGYARTVVALRFLILPAWIVAAVAAVDYLPAFNTQSASGLGAIVPEHSVAIDTEKRSLREFDFPLLSRIAVVQRNPHGLPPLTQLRVIGARLGLETIVARGDDARLNFRAGAAPRLARLTVAMDEVQFAAEVRRTQPLVLRLQAWCSGPW